MDLDVIIYYEFIDNKLVRGAYFFQKKHTNLNNYISDYKNIYELLEKKYGEPDEDGVYFENDLYKDDYQNFGVAVAMGFLTLRSSWDNGDTKIINLLRGDNLEISHAIIYKDKKSTEIINDNKEKGALNQL